MRHAGWRLSHRGDSLLECGGFRYLIHGVQVFAWGVPRNGITLEWLHALSFQEVAVLQDAHLQPKNFGTQSWTDPLAQFDRLDT
jgi:hypothetical protein